jgi:dTDP-4-dehydrorhamnose reductase
MRVTIIGTSGQLATELHVRAPKSSFDVSPPERVDVSDAAALSAFLDRVQPRLVINASAYTAVDRAESEPARAFAVNEQGPRRLAEWCLANDAPLLHVSTDYVFSGDKALPYVESDVTGPLGVYGASKLAGEVAIREGCPRHCIVRTSWVFSAHGQNFVKTMLRLAGERPELRVVADQRGRPTSASDLADALWRVAEVIRSGREPWGTYHFANAGATTWHAFASAIVDEQAAVTGKQPPVVPITTAEYPTPARRPANSELDTTRFEATFSLTPRPFREPLREVVRDLLKTSAS